MSAEQSAPEPRGKRKSAAAVRNLRAQIGATKDDWLATQGRGVFAGTSRQHQTAIDGLREHRSFWYLPVNGDETTTAIIFSPGTSSKSFALAVRI